MTDLGLTDELTFRGCFMVDRYSFYLSLLGNSYLLRILFTKYCCPIKPLYTAISSLNPAEIGMISSYFKFQAPLE